MPTAENFLAVRASLLQGENLDVLEPNIGAVILQADIAGPWMIFVSEAKLVLRPIWPKSGLFEVREIDRVHSFAVEDDNDFGSGTG